MNIAVIPARGGSKRIPRKNIRLFCGKPMIAHSISAALHSQLFDQIIVSTDCTQIAAIARASGATTPFVRPADLSDDRTPTIPVVAHAVDWYQNHVAEVDLACCIYATAPFILADDLIRGYDLLRSDPSVEFAIPVTTFPFPIFRAVTIRENRIEMMWPDHEAARSQDLPDTYHDVGQFYWGTSNAWRSASGLYSANSVPIPIPRHRVQDIDNQEDWHRAEVLFRVLSEVPEYERTKDVNES